MRRLLALAGALLLAGCGDDSAVSGGDGGKPQLVVFAGSSLKASLTACARDFPEAALRLRFADSARLAADIRRDVPADVLAAESMKPPEALAREGKLKDPVAFATSRLKPAATYGAGVVAAATQPDLAEAFVDDLLAGGCHEALLAAGFGEPR